MSDIADDTVSVEREEGLVVVTLRRAAAANSLDHELKTRLLQVVQAVAADETVRAVLLAADGRNFCVGQDLGEHATGLAADPAHAMDTVGEHYNPLLTALAAIRVPVVVAIQGACVGAGLGIALAGDIRIAAEGASFATAFTAIGLASDSGLTRTLVDAVGASRARGLILLGDRFTAAEAHAWGIVHRVVPDDDLPAAARTVAARLAAGPTAGLVAAKRLVADALPPLGEALERERTAAEALGATADHRAAVAAFLDKARPTFTGR
ncbi:enoyl-CoA hydratase-related protein [Tsukamurella sp. 8F]|uniref:enoyl-CoA hydratase/isomerase family protein n=1 Tax=unclassified Tsukamurella TaxID=2633480 RepID=UPI0023B9F5D2|nr:MULTISPECIES: enoyl-CoA hydratase-related protein [unclassified Tsukamurella]MDF0528986.1 enoyl-CoA hydratase-related protein [Tsukamurella sp. 8J]MDF0587359.1 enoyl-CoA hydratase-related protein [Tsukamurella sp. 8F]